MVNLEPPASNLTCFGKCFKVLLCVFNVFFLFSGVAACGTGVWAIVDPASERIASLLNSELFRDAALVLIGAGVVAVIVSIIGCCGARYENRCLLIVYSVFLLLVFVTEFAGGVVALMVYTQARTFANMEMRDSLINKYGQGNQGDATDAWNYVQEEYDCCGFQGDGHEAAQLYQISLWFEFSLIKVPPSCCKRNDEGEPINLQSCQSRLNHDYDMTFVNNVGCRDAVVDQTIRFTTIIAGVGIGISLMQLIGLLFAFCLFRQI